MSIIQAGATHPSFFDANVWLYAIIDSQDPQKAAVAKQLIGNTTNISVSMQTINEVCVNIIKNKFLSEEALRELIDSFYIHYQVIDISRGIIRKGSELRERYTLSYWDSLVIAAALAHGCYQLFSEDMQDGLQIDNQLSIINPFK